MIAISQQVLLIELNTAKDVLEKWIEKVEAGIPGVDVPMTGMTPAAERFDVWLFELMGELQLVSGKTANIVSILSELQAS